MVEQLQRPHHNAALDDLLLEIKKFHILTSRKDNYCLDFLRKNFWSAGKVSVSWESSEDVEYSINAIVVNSGTLSATLNLKSEDCALANYQPLIKFLLDLFKEESIAKIVYNKSLFIESLKRLWKLTTIKFKNTVDLSSPKYFSLCDRGRNILHLDD
jgi:hypothetical protein